MTGLSREGSVEAVGILHHGWRIPVSSKFPKAISAWPVKPSYQHLSLFNIAVIELLGAAALLASRAVHRARNRVAAALERRAEERAQEAACRAVPQVINAGHEDWLLRDGPHSGRPSDPGEGA